MLFYISDIACRENLVKSFETFDKRVADTCQMSESRTPDRPDSALLYQMIFLFVFQGVNIMSILVLTVIFLLWVTGNLKITDGQEIPEE